jgi:hypothetical protein
MALNLTLNPNSSINTVEFVIQILKKAAKLASEAEARRREAWAGFPTRFRVSPL